MLSFFLFGLPFLAFHGEFIEVNFTSLEGLSLFSITDNFDALNLITFGDGIHNGLIRSVYHIAKNRVFSIQMRCRTMGNKKLAPIGSGTGIGHRENPRP